jgi:hypothetical protein
MDELDQLKYMAGLTDHNQGKLMEYNGPDSPTRNGGSNPSITAAEKINYQNTNNVQPGTPEWFQLWFSKPYLTGEKPW